MHQADFSALRPEE